MVTPLSKWKIVRNNIENLYSQCVLNVILWSQTRKKLRLSFSFFVHFSFSHLKIIRHIWIFVKHKNCYYVTAISDISFSYAGEQIQVKYVLPNLRCKCIFEIWFVFAFLTTLQISRNLRLSFVMAKACFLNLFCYLNIGD